MELLTRAAAVVLALKVMELVALAEVALPAMLAQQTLAVVVAVETITQQAARTAALELSSFVTLALSEQVAEQLHRLAATPITHSHRPARSQHKEKSTWDILQK